jgi:NhaP-type Na+/H+ or K+/H+ antiporter
VVGLLTAVVVHWLRVRLRDAGLETVLGIVVPFAAYLAAEAVHGSGVLAVVVAGFFLGHHAANAGFETRLQSRQVWRSMDVLLEAFVFAYIGLQLRFVIEDLVVHHIPLDVFLRTAMLVLLAVMLTRPVWITFTFGPARAFAKRLTVRSAVARRIEERIRRWGGQSKPPLRQAEEPPWTYSVLMSWTGMRGVVTLAAAAGVPVATATGAPFPDRAFIQGSAFVVAVGTLLIQGFTLPPLIRSLKIVDSGTREHERDETRRAQTVAREAARQATAQMVAQSPHGIDRIAMYAIELRVEQYLNAYQTLHQAAESVSIQESERLLTVRTLIQRILAQQRRALVHERDTGRLDDETLRGLLEQLDYEEAAASADVPSRL